MNSKEITSSEIYTHLSKRYAHSHIDNNSISINTDEQQIGKADEILLGLQKERRIVTSLNTDEPQVMPPRLKEEIFHDSICMK